MLLQKGPSSPSQDIGSREAQRAPSQHHTVVVLIYVALYASDAAVAADPAIEAALYLNADAMLWKRVVPAPLADWVELYLSLKG